jgi:ATP-dependent exoDNAse (exonuclease V) alpha subunit
VGIAELQKAIDSAQDLIPFTSQKGQHYTTQTALNREQHTIALLRDGQGMAPAIAPLASINQTLRGQPLSQEQRQAIELAATSSDQVLAWQGVAEAGKTYAMREFSQIAQAAGYEVKGYAPSAEAAKTLEAETGIPSQTIARLLYSQPRDGDQSNPQVWICDEAGLLSAKDAEWLLAGSAMKLGCSLPRMPNGYWHERKPIALD